MSVLLHRILIYFKYNWHKDKPVTIAGWSHAVSTMPDYIIKATGKEKRGFEKLFHR
jgi:hypothetical protein